MELKEKATAVLKKIYEDEPGARDPRFTVKEFCDAAGVAATDEEEMVIAHELKDKGFASVKEAEDKTHGKYLIALTPEGESRAKEATTDS